MLKFARRAFIKAVAGAWGLSYTDQLTIIDTEKIPADNPSEPHRIHQSDPHDGMFIAQQGSIHASIEVIVYPGHHQPVGIELSFNGLDFGVALTSEEAEVFGEKIITAASEADNA